MSRRMVKITTALNMEGANPFQKYVNFLITSKFVLEKDVPADQCLSIAMRIEGLLNKGREDEIVALLVDNFYTLQDLKGNTQVEDHNESELNALVNIIKEKHNEMFL